MAKYFSRDDAIKTFMQMQFYDEDGFAIDDADEKRPIVEDWVDCIPPADVVHVVRCKDCKWWDQKDDSPYGYCHAAKHAYYSSHWEIGIYRTYKSDWFCKDGERKDNE